MSEDPEHGLSHSADGESGAQKAPAKGRSPAHVPAPHIDPPKTLSQRFAEAVTRTVGSGKFVVAQTATLALWLLGNTIAMTQHWDPAPFILLNLALSFQAAYTGPFVMISQNRQAEIDRMAEDYDHKVNLDAQRSVEELHGKVNTLLGSLSPMVRIMTPEQRAALNIPDDILTLILEGPQKEQEDAAAVVAEDAQPPKPEKMTLSQRFSEAVSKGVGSLKFVAIQSASIAAWIGLNTVALVSHWDPYPYILLNLMLSFQAAYTGPFVLMSQNRQSDLDRKAAENDHQVNRDAQARIQDLNRKMDALVSLVAPAMAALTPDQHDTLAKLMMQKPAGGEQTVVPDAHMLPPPGSEQRPSP